MQRVCAAERNSRFSVVERVAEILFAFSRATEPLGVSELARRTGLPKSTVHRLATEMAAHHLLERRGEAFEPADRLYELGARKMPDSNLRAIALPFMADLRSATRQTVHLAVLDGTEVVYVEILRQQSAPRLPSGVGGRMPAHATAVGKAMMAFSPAADVEAVIRHGLNRIGPRTTVAPGLLRRELSRIRANGVAVEFEESAPGLVCAASPILGDDGAAVAAISISGWIGKLNPRRMAPAVRTAALSIGRELAGGANTPASGRSLDT
jgi:DNA-binding IclR family transcriptional regulator